eukprot:1802211-Karenia_brevis.AAC.1
MVPIRLTSSCTVAIVSACPRKIRGSEQLWGLFKLNSNGTLPCPGFSFTLGLLRLLCRALR